MANTVQIPKPVLSEFLEAGRRFNAAEDALENFLLAADKDFIKKMRDLRNLHKAGKLSDWSKLKTKYGL
ncbi:MAG: hypothetical protein HYW90_02105 [Candidatus Sungbacteria bacterium]|nr:hypothetical protein [Candidatus Sungbacteria bacterium]